MPPVYFETAPLRCAPLDSALSLKKHVASTFGVPVGDLYVTSNGRLVSGDSCLDSCDAVRVFSRLVGGKGGFGSMLRAIGAQIEKTTNREACRDLSGRRLRDINEEQRLRKWLDGQADREKEAVDRKQKKLERLCAEPKPSTNINDPKYESERQMLPERVSAAVDAGWQASAAGSSKRKSDGEPETKKKKKKLWIDEDLSDCSSASEEESEAAQAKPGVSTDSGNESDRLSDGSKTTA